MIPVLVASSWTGAVVLGVFAALIVGGIVILDRRHNPLRRLARYRVRSAPKVRFERIACAAMGEVSEYPYSCRYTLSYALDEHWVYLRHSGLIPFCPTFWRLPRKEVRPIDDAVWTVRIKSAEPPFSADFGSEFVRALRATKP